MPPGEIVLIAFAVLAAISGVGYGTYRYERWKALSPKKQYELLKAAAVDRAKTAELEAALVCASCGNSVDLVMGIHDTVNNAWWHRECYINMIKEGL